MIFCSVGCFTASLGLAKQPEAEPEVKPAANMQTAATAAPVPETITAAAAKATPAPLPEAIPAATKATPAPMLEAISIATNATTAPTEAMVAASTNEALASANVSKASATTAATPGAVHCLAEVHTCGDGKSHASAEIRMEPSDKAGMHDDQLANVEADMERQLFQDALDAEQAAIARAEEAEQKTAMLSRLLSRVMQENPSSLHAGMAPAIRAMLRRPATADLEALTQAMDEHAALAASQPAPASAADATAPAHMQAGAPGQDTAEVPQRTTEVPKQAVTPGQDNKVEVSQRTAVHEQAVAPVPDNKIEVPQRTTVHEQAVAPGPDNKIEVPQRTTVHEQAVAPGPDNKIEVPQRTTVAPAPAPAGTAGPAAVKQEYTTDRPRSVKADAQKAAVAEPKFGYVTKEGMTALFGQKSAAAATAFPAATAAAHDQAKAGTGNHLAAATTGATAVPATAAPAHDQARAGTGNHLEAATTHATAAPAVATAPEQTQAKPGEAAAATTTNHDKEAHNAYMRYYRSIRSSSQFIFECTSV